MSPVTGLAWLPGRILWCSYGKFKPSQPGWIQETQPKWWNINLSHTPEVEIHTTPKLCHFCHYVVRAKLFCLKCFIPVTGLEYSHGKIFIPVTEILVAKPKISVTAWASPASHVNTSIFFSKKRVTRPDLGNRASPVDWAHMKMPSVMTDHVMSMLHVRHEVSGWSNKRAWEQIVDIWPTLLEFGLINDPLLFITGRWWCRSLAKMTKRVKIEKSKLFFVIPKIVSVIPYPHNYLVSYPLSLKPVTGPRR